MVPIVALVKLKLYMADKFVWIAPDNFGVLLPKKSSSDERYTNVTTKYDPTTFAVEETPDQIQAKILAAARGEVEQDAGGPQRVSKNLLKDDTEQI